MSIQAIERAFAVMRVLALGPTGVTTLAEQVDLPKSTVARILSSLEAEGAVEQDEWGGEYRLGATLMELSASQAPARNLAAIARPHLENIVELTGETAGISVLDEGQIYYLDHADGESDVQVRDWTGEYAPLHAVPSGLVILAHMPKRQVRQILSEGLESTTPNTMTDPAELIERLTQIHSIGYSWVFEEFAEGINSVAAPVIDSDGKVEAALHIHGPAYRFPDPDRTHDIGLQLIAAADRLAEQLDL